MFSRILTLPLPLSLALVAPLLMACGPSAEATQQADAPKLRLAAQATDGTTLQSLIAAAPAILIAEVTQEQPSATPAARSEPSEPTEPREEDYKIDLQKELDRAREETSRTFTGFNIGPLIRLKTVDTLKGPATDILTLPATDADFKTAAPGDLFLIIMGNTHPDAVRPISSLEDPWVAEVKAALAE